MKGRWSWIALHSALAGVFFFSLQHWGLLQPLEVSAVWAIVAAAAAAWLAWSQANRGG